MALPGRGFPLPRPLGGGWGLESQGHLGAGGDTGRAGPGACGASGRRRWERWDPPQICLTRCRALNLTGSSQILHKIPYTQSSEGNIQQLLSTEHSQSGASCLLSSGAGTSDLCQRVRSRPLGRLRPTPARPPRPGDVRGFASCVRSAVGTAAGDQRFRAGCDH